MRTGVAPAGTARRRPAGLRRATRWWRRAAAGCAARSARRAGRARAALRLRRCRPARALRRARRPSTRSMASRGTPPGRSSIGSPRQATMVDSTPTGVAPPSTMRSMRPRRSASTCCAVVGETWPERLADGATTGRPKRREDVARDRMVRHAHRDAVEAGGGELGDRAVCRLRQHQRQRARPERRREPLGRCVEARERAAPPRGRAHARSAD